MDHKWKLTPDAEYRMREIALQEAVKLHGQRDELLPRPQSVVDTAKAFEIYLTE